MNRYAILTPYLVPATMPGKKTNIGDGFILRAIERLIGPFGSERVFTSRASPPPAAIREMENAGTVILGGANQLNDDFSVWPGATANDVRERPVRFVPFGVGLDGLPRKNQKFTAQAHDIIEAIHEKIEYSSWRCGRTVALLEEAFPNLKGRFLMTGCPVVFDRPLLESAKFSDSEGSIAVTITERDDFWDRESGVLRYTARRFPRSQKTLVLHQLFEPITEAESGAGNFISRLFESRRVKLRRLARQLGYEIVAPVDCDSAIRFYRDVDLHIGSRLHAHLLFLSRNKRTFLIPVDDRSLGFSEYFGFPLVDYSNIDSHLTFDFEIVRTRARSAFLTMQTFVNSLSQS